MIRTRIKHHWPALLLIPAVLSLFGPALLNPAAVLFPTFSEFSDIMVIHWPKAHLMAQSWQAGENLPYWTPLTLSGMPLAANQLAMLFYPPAWLFLFFPLIPVFNWLFIFHFLWGGLGIYFLLYEKYNLSAAAALVGGVVFALNGKWLAHAAGGHVSLVSAIGWLPWTVFGVQMLLEAQGVGERRSRGVEEQGRNFRHFLSLGGAGSGWAILVAVSLAMQMVTHTLPVIYSMYLIVAMLAWHAASQPAIESVDQKNARGDATHNTPHASRFLRSFAHSLIHLLPILLLTALIGAAQVLPLLELAQFSNRSLSLKEATEFALSPVQLLIGLLLPAAKGGHEYVIYVGLVSLLLAPFGLSRKNRWSWFYGLLFIFTVLFALGPNNPLHSLFYYAVPGFRWVRTPARIFLVGALALAVLAGFGADRLTQAQWSPRAKKWLTRLAVAVGPLALLLGLGLAFGLEKIEPALQRSALALAIFIPVSLVLILLRVRRVLPAQLTVTALGLLLFLDLAWFDISMLRFVPLSEALSPGQAAAEYLAQKPGYFRVYSPSYSLPMQTAAAADLSLADGVEPVHLAGYDQFMARAGGYNDAGFSVTIPKFGPGPLETSLKDVEPDLKLLGLLNVAYLASAFPMPWPGLTLETQVGDTFIYRNEQALPRAWVAHQAVPAEANWLAQLQALPDVGGTVVIGRPAENGEDLALSAEQAGSPPRSTAEITGYSADRIDVATEITQPGWLVLSEMWYPGWQATVNGATQPIEKVDGLLRGIELSQAGAYQIRLIYRPNSVILGNWISGITVALLILGSVWAGWHLRR